MHTRLLQSMADEGLVRLALCGEMEAYNTLVDRFRAAVILVAEQTLHSREVAEDVAQEVFLVAFQSLPRLRDPKRFASWLYAITRYRARRVLKQERRFVSLETDPLHAVAVACSTGEATHPEAVLLNNLFKDELVCALANLKPELQLVFRLRYEEEWSIARISEFIALPIPTIKWRLHQTRKLLKQQLQSYEQEDKHE
jgi:RNA polymerase sigma-70 factor (ECF subfamily)